MEVILRSTDITQIPYVKMLLSSEEINVFVFDENISLLEGCLLYTSPSPRDVEESRMPSSA